MGAYKVSFCPLEIDLDHLLSFAKNSLCLRFLLSTYLTTLDGADSRYQRENILA